MSLLSHLGDLQAAGHIFDAVEKADAQLHAAHKGEETHVAVSGARFKTASGRHFHIPYIPLVAEDDPRPPAHPPAPTPGPAPGQ